MQAFAIKQYGKAIRLVVELDVHGSGIAAEVALLAGLLFTCIESV